MITMDQVAALQIGEEVTETVDCKFPGQVGVKRQADTKTGKPVYVPWAQRTSPMLSAGQGVWSPAAACKLLSRYRFWLKGSR